VGIGTLLTISIPAALISPYETVENGKPYREWLVPAAVLNGSGKVKIRRTR
jgi:hypothetical protein